MANPSLSPAEREKNRIVSSTIKPIPQNDAVKVVVWGKRGTLEHFKFVLDAPHGDLEELSKTFSYTVPASRRSRYLGDTVKTAVKEHLVSRTTFPSRRGTAIPGRPIQMQYLPLSDIDIFDLNRYTVQVQGNMRLFIAHLIERTDTRSIQLWGMTGNRYLAPIPGPSGSSLIAELQKQYGTTLAPAAPVAPTAKKP